LMVDADRFASPLELCARGKPCRDQKVAEVEGSWVRGNLIPAADGPSGPEERLARRAIGDNAGAGERVQVLADRGVATRSEEPVGGDITRPKIAWGCTGRQGVEWTR